jgi:thiamine-monophosphate kinase
MEREFLRWLRGRLPGDPRLIVPPGDDAAVLRLGGSDVVVTVDLLTEGVDFLLAQHDPRKIGRKALAVNLSDLAAMAARPLAAFVAVALPRDGARELAESLLAGMQPLAEEFGLAIAGGDTNTWDGPLVLSVTALGEPGPGGSLRRNGARPGDVLMATGSFGGSILAHQFDFTPRVREALLLAERYPLGAGIDVSDGLAIDALHLAEESGCGVALDLARVPIAPDAERLAFEKPAGGTALDHALGDGEDFELLLAVAPEVARRMLDEQPLGATPLTEIGRFVDAPGLWQLRQGALTALAPRGWEHRASS